MSWLSGFAEGDWVELRRPVETFGLLSGGTEYRRGTKGVVLASSGWSGYLVSLETGFGAAEVIVKGADLRLRRRDGGVDRWRERAARRNAARAGVAVAMLGPLLLWTAKFFIDGHNQGEFIVALLDGVVWSAVELLELTLSSPLTALAYVAVVTIAWRFVTRG